MRRGAVVVKPANQFFTPNKHPASDSRNSGNLPSFDHGVDCFFRSSEQSRSLVDGQQKR